MNPFLKDSNYLQDLETQNEFLKPINSSILSSNK
jgi:heme oxygenase